MPSCRKQVGKGYNDFGQTIKLKRLWQSGGAQGRQKYVYGRPDFYIPNRITHGAGIGSLFAPLFRYLAPVVSPLISKGLNAVKKELLSAGVDILQNPSKETVRKRSREIVDNLADKASKKIKLMTGSGVRKKNRIKRLKQKKVKHSGVNSQRVKRKSKKKRKPSSKKRKIVRRGRGRRSKKISRINDIFS